MRKKILFIINNLHCGGAEKALISLLETLDYSMYDVDLFLFKHEGLFLGKIPKQVKVLEVQPEYSYFDMSIKSAVMKCLRKGKINIMISRLIAGVINKTEKNSVRREQRVWKYISKSITQINTEYDIAVGYLEKNPIYFCVDKVNASKKIGFIHNDYEKLGLDPLLDKSFFNKLDYLVTVSNECANILKKIFPSFKRKVKVMHNIISPTTIKKLALEQVEMKGEEIKLISVGRLNYQKGFELAIRSCKELIVHGYKVKWYVIGDGEDRGMLEQLIRENKLEGIFCLLGIRENPYPYIKEADIYIQPSRFEGKSIAIDEAKILGKPIVITNFSTAKDQITHNQNGLIVEMDYKSIFLGIKSLIDNNELKKRLTLNLSKESLGTESELRKLYNIFNA